MSARRPSARALPALARLFHDPEGRRGLALLFLAGGGLAMTAYAGVALWLVRTQPQEVFYLGLVALIRYLPGALAAPIAGVMIDRHSRRTVLVGSAALMFLMMSAAMAQKVNSDWQHGTDFSKFKTYAWGESPHPIQDSIWNQRIVSDIDSQLAGKGLQKVSADQNPDIVVVYNAGVKQNRSLEGYRTGGWFNSTANIQEVVENDGTLVVDMATPQDKTVIWRGMASDTLADKSDKNIKKVENGEEELKALGFRQFRVRFHGEIARIEIARDELEKALSLEMAGKFTSIFKRLGFQYVTLDLEGYRQGSLNEVLIRSAPTR